MLTFEKALEIVISSARQMDSEQIPLECSLNRILAGDVISDTDMPAFNKSAMDGYACRKEDLHGELKIIEMIPAGYVPKKKIEKNQCAKIMTGAIVPDGADCVVKVESTQNPSTDSMRFKGMETAVNICFKGEDVKTGDVLLRKGEKILPQHLAVLAAVGCARPIVSKLPRVGIIATGDELVEPSEKPAQSQIRNSNGVQLYGQALSVGVIANYHGIARDTNEAIELALAKAQDDIVLISGGVSMGDFDLIPKVLKKNDINLLFEKIAIKPGNPTVFGISKKSFFFGLPGNPVSTFVLFELLVKPFIYKLMGHDFAAKNIFMPLAKTISQKSSDRDKWIPVILTKEGRVTPVDFHGSAHITALCKADGLICIPRGSKEIREGTIVNVRQI